MIRPIARSLKTAQTRAPASTTNIAPDRSTSTDPAAAAEMAMPTALTKTRATTTADRRGEVDQRSRSSGMGVSRGLGATSSLRAHAVRLNGICAAHDDRATAAGAGWLRSAPSGRDWRDGHARIQDPQRRAGRRGGERRRGRLRVGWPTGDVHAAYPDWVSISGDTSGRGHAEVPGSSPGYYRIVILDGKVFELSLDHQQDCYE